MPATFLTISDFIKQEIIEGFKVPPLMVTAIPLAPDPLFGLCSAAFNPLMFFSSMHCPTQSFVYPFFELLQGFTS